MSDLSHHDGMLNRIEELEAENKRLREEYRYIGKDGKPILARELEDQRDEAREKLAKAVGVDLIEQAISDVLSEGGTYRDAAEYVARTTLAELTGGKDE